MAERRTTTVHSRFEVGCSYCGVIGYERTLRKAVAIAQHAQTQHVADNETVLIFDLMAHIGKAQNYDAAGMVIGIRE